MIRQERRPSVLLIEDDDIDAAAIERAFKRDALDADLVRARSAEEALELLRDEASGKLRSPFVTLLDLNMPGMGGHGFLQTIRTDDRLKRLVVFVLSTSIDTSEIDRAYQQQIAGYFLKTIESGRNEKIMNTLRAYFAAALLPEI